MIHDFPVGLHQGLGVERRFTVEHLVHADAETPPVALGPVAALAVLHRAEDLRGDVVRRAHGHVALHRPVLGQLQTRPEVRQPDVAVGVEEDVVGLDVAVDVAEAVDGVDGEDHLRDVEPRHLLRQPVLELAEEGQQVAAAVVVHHQVLENNKIKVFITTNNFGEMDFFKCGKERTAN